MSHKSNMTVLLVASGIFVVVLGGGAGVWLAKRERSATSRDGNGTAQQHTLNEELSVPYPTRWGAATVEQDLPETYYTFTDKENVSLYVHYSASDSLQLDYNTVPTRGISVVQDRQACEFHAEGYVIGACAELDIDGATAVYGYVPEHVEFSDAVIAFITPASRPQSRVDLVFLVQGKDPVQSLHEVRNTLVNLAF